MLALVWGRGPWAEPLSLDSGLATWVGMLFTRPGGHGGDGGSLRHGSRGRLHPGPLRKIVCGGRDSSLGREVQGL